MRIEQLFYLIEISRSYSLNLASEKLHISTQALSASIKSLENELNTTILIRTNRGISFTDAGHRVLQYAHDVVSKYHELQNDLGIYSTASHKKTTLTGDLTLHVAPVFLESILPYKLQEFQQQYPNIKVHVTQHNIHDTCLAVNNLEKTTLGMILLPYNKNMLMRSFLPEGNFLFRPISISRYVCVVPKNSLLAKHKTISINKVLKEPLIIYTTGSFDNSPLHYLLKQYTEQPNVASTISSITFWAKAIKNHMGIGFLNELFVSPQSMVKDIFDDLVFIKVKEPLIAVNGFIYNEKPTFPAEAFMNLFPAYRPSKGDPQFYSEYMIL